VARFQLGEILLRQGRLSSAEEELRAVVTAQPDSAEARGRLGAILLAQGRSDEAENELVEAVRLAPRSATPLNDLGLLYLRTGRFPLAVETLERAVEAAPGEAPVRNNLGNALRDAGRLDESVAVLEEALELDPELAATHYNLGLTYERAERPTDARRAFARAVELDPRHGAARRAIGRLALAAGDLEGCLPFLDEAIRIDGTDVEAHALRARANFRLGRYASAKADFMGVLDLNPGSVEARNNLGIIAALEGDVEGARRWWEQALEIAPDAEAVRQNLRDLDGPHPTPNGTD